MPSNSAIKSPMKFKIPNKKLLSCYIAILLITLFGGFLRFYNLNWDQGHFFHPDERNIAAAVSRISFFDQLNPKFFAYGSLPIYFFRAIGETLAVFLKNPAWVYDWQKINLISRGVSAFFSSLTIILVFLITQEIWNKKSGLITAFLTSFTVSLIQTAHYGVTESLLVFWLMLMLFFSLRLLDKQTMKGYLKIGLVSGLALATKISALSFFIIPLITHFFISTQHRKQFKYLNYQLRFFISMTIAFLTFAIFSPYVFLDKKSFLESMIYESGVATGKLKVVYTLQFEKTLPYLFQLKNLIWQIGPIALLSFLGFLLLIFMAVKQKDKKILIFLSFPLVYFTYAGSWYTKFIRYMVPMIPFLTIAAGWLLYEFWKKSKLIGGALLVLSFTLTLVWSLAFFTIYTKESTRITASKWIYQGLPQGAKILGEHWDDGLPIDYSGNHPDWYQIKQLTIYEADDSQKIEYYGQELSEADYIVINSRRLYGTLMYLPEKYPITSRYYRLLFAGKLGYQKIAEFTSYPSIFGLEINDDSSEETFQVYEHPKVIILKNQNRYTRQQIKSIIEKNEIQPKTP